MNGKQRLRNKALTEREREKNSRKSSVRAKVEHAFLIIKRIFGFAKVSYRGMAKNGNRLFVVAALANLFMARTICCDLRREGASDERKIERYGWRNTL